MTRTIFTGIEGSVGLIDKSSYWCATGHPAALHNAVALELARLQARVAELEASIQAALRIQELWIPGVVSKEHEGEAIALHKMRENFLSVTAKH